MDQWSGRMFQEHDLDVMGSNPGWVEFGICSTSSP